MQMINAHTSLTLISDCQRLFGWAYWCHKSTSQTSKCNAKQRRYNHWLNSSFFDFPLLFSYWYLWRSDFNCFWKRTLWNYKTLTHAPRVLMGKEVGKRMSRIHLQIDSNTAKKGSCTFVFSLKLQHFEGIVCLLRKENSSHYAFKFLESHLTMETNYFIYSP